MGAYVPNGLADCLGWGCVAGLGLWLGYLCYTYGAVFYCVVLHCFMSGTYLYLRVECVK